jgi:hypothetical protein
LKKHDGVPGDFATVEERLQLDDNDPDNRRYYAVMVTGGWLALAGGIVVAMVVIGLAVSRAPRT